MEYQYSVYWLNISKDKEIFLGDFITIRAAQEEVEYWCSVCEEAEASDPQNYDIRRYNDDAR